MNPILFDDKLRRIRHNRAIRLGGDPFLRERAFADSLDRLGDVRRRFGRLLVAGRHSDHWPAALAAYCDDLTVADSWAFDPASLDPRSYDLCLTIGGLETANDLPAAAFALRHCLKPGGLLIGAIIGGASLPRLRAAMLAADRTTGRIAQRLHPMIDGPSLGTLLTSVGLQDPVIDVDRIDVTYPSLDRLVGDLRAMGCTNILAGRSPPALNRQAVEIAREAFLDGKPRATERFDLLGFSAWAPKD